MISDNHRKFLVKYGSPEIQMRMIDEHAKQISSRKGNIPIGWGDIGYYEHNMQWLHHSAINHLARSIDSSELASVILRHRDVHPDTIDHLVRKYPSTTHIACLHKNTTEKTLDYIHHADDQCHILIASHHNTSLETLKRLYADNHDSNDIYARATRANVVDNPNIDIDTLTHAANLNDKYISPIARKKLDERKSP